MQHEGERWVRRLRDGEFPPIWHTVVGVTIAIAAGVAAGVFAILHAGSIVNHSTGWLGDASYFVFPWLIAGSGGLNGVGTLRFRRSDRAVVRRVREAGRAPAFFLPTLPKYRGSTFDFARLDGRRPALWTIDADGLQAWSPSSPAPVIDLP